MVWRRLARCRMIFFSSGVFSGNVVMGMGMILEVWLRVGSKNGDGGDIFSSGVSG